MKLKITDKEILAAINNITKRHIDWQIENCGGLDKYKIEHKYYHQIQGRFIQREINFRITLTQLHVRLKRLAASGLIKTHSGYPTNRMYSINEPV